MGPLGVPELIFILVLALLILGPKKLPEFGRTLGRGLSEFKKASNELKRSFNTEIARDVKDIHDEIRDHHPRRMLAKVMEDDEPEPARSDAKTPDADTPRGAVARSAEETDETSAEGSPDAAARASHPSALP